jgi:hypothetical protein
MATATVRRGATSPSPPKAQGGSGATPTEGVQHQGLHTGRSRFDALGPLTYHMESNYGNCIMLLSVVPASLPTSITHIDAALPSQVPREAPRGGDRGPSPPYPWRHPRWDRKARPRLKSALLSIGGKAGSRRAPERARAPVVQPSRLDPTSLQDLFCQGLEPNEQPTEQPSDAKHHDRDGTEPPSTCRRCLGHPQQSPLTHLECGKARRRPRLIEVSTTGCSPLKRAPGKP